MPAGALRESVTFQRQSEGAGDGAGNYGSAFADLTGAIGIWAELTPLKYGETVLAEGVQGRRLYRVRMRWDTVLAGLKVTDRMVDNTSGVVFNVKSPPVNPDQKRKYLELFAETGGASG